MVFVSFVLWCSISVIMNSAKNIVARPLAMAGFFCAMAVISHMSAMRVIVVVA